MSSVDDALKALGSKRQTSSFI